LKSQKTKGKQRKERGTVIVGNQEFFHRSNFAPAWGKILKGGLEGERNERYGFQLTRLQQARKGPRLVVKKGGWRFAKGLKVFFEKLQEKKGRLRGGNSPGGESVHIMMGDFCRLLEKNLKETGGELMTKSSKGVSDGRKGGGEKSREKKKWRTGAFGEGGVDATTEGKEEGGAEWGVGGLEEGKKVAQNEIGGNRPRGREFPRTSGRGRKKVSGKGGGGKNPQL